MGRAQFLFSMGNAVITFRGMMETATIVETSGVRPSFREALRFWIRLGFISFGGPAGQIAIMQTEPVGR